MSRKRLLKFGTTAVVVAILIGWLVPPLVLKALGLHPHFAGERFDLKGRRALVIATNHGALGDTGRATGVAMSELTAPYYEFLDAGMTVDVASPAGGPIAIDPQTLLWLIRAPSDDRYLDDPELARKMGESLSVAEIDPARYDLIYMAGGWGAAWDLGTSQPLGDLVTAANARGTVLGSVCHGALGFLLAKSPSGAPLVEGRRLTAVTDKQVRELGIDSTPQHPETELRKRGAAFESETAFRDIFANHVVVDGNLVTGQNQNAGTETAQRMLGLLRDRVSGGAS